MTRRVRVRVARHVYRVGGYTIIHESRSVVRRDAKPTTARGVLAQLVAAVVRP